MGARMTIIAQLFANVYFAKYFFVLDLMNSGSEEERVS